MSIIIGGGVYEEKIQRGEVDKEVQHGEVDVVFRRKWQMGSFKKRRFRDYV